MGSSIPKFALQTHPPTDFPGFALQAPKNIRTLENIFANTIFSFLYLLTLVPNNCFLQESNVPLVGEQFHMKGTHLPQWAFLHAKPPQRTTDGNVMDGLLEARQTENATVENHSPPNFPSQEAGSPLLQITSCRGKHFSLFSNSLWFTCLGTNKYLHKIC